MTDVVRIASRSSRLAMAQSEWVSKLLSAAWPDRTFQIVNIDTKGDRVLDRPLPEIGGKGLFTEELEAALRDGYVDVAVHSLKDLPTDLAAGLKVGAVCPREDPRDAWVAPAGGPTDIVSAAPGAVIGTSSERRRALLALARPDLEARSVRGNVETRLRKADEGQYDALVMAAAGLIRLGLAHRITTYLEPPDWLSAPGQGAVAVESRADDAATDQLLLSIDDRFARAETDAERTLLHTLQGGCQVPVGARAVVDGDEVVLQALVARPDGSEVVRGEGRGPVERAIQLGETVAEDLLARGGDAIVATFREMENKG
jgi:hydroxymethylbilane synthase